MARARSVGFKRDVLSASCSSQLDGSWSSWIAGAICGAESACFGDGSATGSSGGSSVGWTSVLTSCPITFGGAMSGRFNSARSQPGRIPPTSAQKTNFQLEPVMRLGAGREMSTEGAQTSQPKAAPWENYPITIKPRKGGTRDVPPFQGWGGFYRPTQGVALGWLVAGPVALHCREWQKGGYCGALALRVRERQECMTGARRH